MKKLFFALLLICLFSQVAKPIPFASFIGNHYGKCCHIYYIYSIDRTTWMYPTYFWLANPSGYPNTGTYMGWVAVTLSSWRIFYDLYLGTHQFTCQNYNLQNHIVPYYYSGYNYPTMWWNFGWGWCDLISNLSHPFNHLANQINQYHDHTIFSLFFPATPFVIPPSWGTISNVINALNAIKPCKVIIIIYIIRWWFFWFFRRNLQGPSFEDLLGGAFGQQINIGGPTVDIPSFPSIPDVPNRDQSGSTGNDGSSIEASAQSAFAQLKRDTPAAQPKADLIVAEGQSISSSASIPRAPAAFAQYERYDERTLSDAKSRLQQAGAEIQEVYITSQSQLENALKGVINDGNRFPK